MIVVHAHPIKFIYLQEGVFILKYVERLDRYRGYESWKNWSRDGFGSFSVLDSRYFNEELRRAGINSCERLKFFEIGFGNGSFAGYVLANGGDYIGSELNDELIERALNSGVNVVHNGLADLLAAGGEASFDAIVAFDVLEHLDIESIKQFLKDANSLLKPNGVVIARIPSGDSPFGRALFYGDITHLTLLGTSAVRQLAELSGFSVWAMGTPMLPLKGGGVVRFFRRCILRATQRVISWGINQVFHEGQSCVVTPNLVFVLKKKAGS